LGASFRDPSGFLFSRQGILYRQVNQVYSEEYRRFMDSGLYDKLVTAGLLVAHREVDIQPEDPATAYLVLQPELVPFISYPYEWSFRQLKDAALATLSIQKRALKVDLTLKDASAYNIQFFHGRATLIDSLSFEAYQEGEPWVAYRQFCQHFLAPLALSSLLDVRLNQLLRVYIDGIPLDLTSRLLPWRTRLMPGLSMHIHMHARAQERYAESDVREARSGRKLSKHALLDVVQSLEETVRGLRWKPGQTEWGDYYDATNYSQAAFEQKKQLVTEWSRRVGPRMVWDLGANNGIFTRLAVGQGYALAIDSDPLAVDRDWRSVKHNKEKNILPIWLDLTNPSPDLGWDNQERESLSRRGPADLVLALALVHHLAISNNVPLPMLAGYLAGLGDWLIIEFVPKQDSQVQRLLRNRKDIFGDYTPEGFEREFGKFYQLVESQPLPESSRRMYLMKKLAV
jgi:ribosomal protein L11 methylase PrmA